jgi:hypothetical protein
MSKRPSEQSASLTYPSRGYDPTHPKAWVFLENRAFVVLGCVAYDNSDPPSDETSFFEKYCEIFLSKTMEHVGKSSDNWIPKNGKLTELFRNYATNEDAIAASRLFQTVCSTKNSEPKYAEMLRVAADLGHARAQEMMFKTLCKYDESQAVEYLKRAAAQGLSSALLSLSSVYNGHSLSIPRDRELAELLCQAANDLHDPEAQFCWQVGRFTESTFGTPRNFPKGIQNAMSLRDNGNERAISYLDALRNSSYESFMESDEFQPEDLEFLKVVGLWTDEETSDESSD